MYAIINSKTKKFLYGTNYNYDVSKQRQRTSFDRALIFETEFDARLAIKIRKCSKDYKVCKVKINILEILNG